MGAIDEYLCCVLYFAELRKRVWVRTFWNLALKYASELGLEVTHFVSDTYDNDSWRCKTYKYVRRNQNRLAEKGIEQNLRVLDFHYVDKDGDLAMAPLTISMRNRRKNEAFGRVFVQCQQKILCQKIGVVKLLYQLFSDLNHLIRVQYGFVNLMQGNKYPYAYAEGMAVSAYLSDEEELSAKVWEEEGWKFHTAVRRVYWGNVVSKSHWRYDGSREKYLLRNLEEICKGNVFWLNEETLFFCAPFDISDCTEKTTKFDEFKNHILKLYEDVGIEVLNATV